VPLTLLPALTLFIIRKALLDVKVILAMIGEGSDNRPFCHLASDVLFIAVMGLYISHKQQGSDNAPLDPIYISGIDVARSKYP
jgi:hypothetical protein